MRLIVMTLALLAFTPAAASAVTVPRTLPHTDVLLIHYRAHDGVARRAWLLLPVNYNGRPIPLVISAHGRGISARANERIWGDLPGIGRLAVTNPAGEGRRLHEHSWGDPVPRLPQALVRFGLLTRSRAMQI